MMWTGSTGVRSKSSTPTKSWHARSAARLAGTGGRALARCNRRCGAPLTINLYPSNNAVGTVVQAPERSNVDTVIIGGRVRKHRGKVLDLDMSNLSAMVEESRGHLFTAAGCHPNIVAALLPKLHIWHVRAAYSCAVVLKGEAPPPG
jgi:hypothetical protein